MTVDSKGVPFDIISTVLLISKGIFFGDLTVFYSALLIYRRSVYFCMINFPLHVHLREVARHLLHCVRLGSL